MLQILFIVIYVFDQTIKYVFVKVYESHFDFHKTVVNAYQGSYFLRTQSVFRFMIPRTSFPDSEWKFHF